MIGFYSYLGAALAFGLLAVLLLSGGRSNAQGRLLIVAVLATAVWAVLATLYVPDRPWPSTGYQLGEVLRYIAWYAFLLKLFEPAAQRMAAQRWFVRHGLALSVAVALLVLAVDRVSGFRPDSGWQHDLFRPALSGHVLLAGIGLVLIEQLYRNLAPGGRQALKHLFIGLGLVFTFDFYLYSEALLFAGVDQELWNARGFVNMIAVPWLVLSVLRNRKWSPDIFLSRDIVLYSTAFVGSGIYLLVMAGASYYLREYGGSLGGTLRIVFFSLAVVLLVTLLFSVKFRREMLVFLAKHFYRNKYDYRHEWLTLTGALNDAGSGEGSYEAAIRVLAQLVGARAGLLWLLDERGVYRNHTSWLSRHVEDALDRDHPLIRFLERTGYVINLLELEKRVEEYTGLELPAWLIDLPDGWLVVPLSGTRQLNGFVILAAPLRVREVNWEDRDLLKTAAHQVASHLAVMQTSEALAQARQFEVFHRLSSYMVHDLKNVAAGLDMVARNAARHRHNPEFLEDAFDSVATSAADIKRLLQQLRNKQLQAGKMTLIDLSETIGQVIGRCTSPGPLPVLETTQATCRVAAEREQLEHVLLHLIENARLACAADGRVVVHLSAEDGFCVVGIEDTGIGMDEDFIRHRLFRPFDTTRGNAGMGIGMYESREYVQQLGGEIRVHSTPGQGTLVSLRIPACKVAGDTGCVDPLETVSATEPGPPGHREQA
jgi:putative PEP-CTERM system histidine kinase